MLKELLLSTAVALALAGPAFAQAAGERAPDRERAAADGAAPGSVKPQAEGPSGQANTGDVTKTAKEALPDPSQSGAGAAASQAQAPAAGGAPLDTAASRAGVSPETLRELREMALEAEKSAPKPAPKSQEKIAAENEAIEAHRQRFFAR